MNQLIQVTCSKCNTRREEILEKAFVGDLLDSDEEALTITVKNAGSYWVTVETSKEQRAIICTDCAQNLLFHLW